MNMKKAIAILLVVLVAGVAFGAVDTVGGSGVDVVLKATVGGRLYHGFDATGFTASPTAAQIKDLGQSYSSTVSIDLLADETKVIGHYNMLTTGKTNVIVSFSAVALHSKIGNVDYYVPYKVTLDTANGAADKVDVVGTPEIDLGIATGPSNTEITPAAVEFLQTSGAGRKWASYPVNVTINKVKNEAFGLPETESGTEFTGTITAKFTSI